MKKVSKNSRSVSLGSKAPQIVGDVSLICPLNRGLHARVLEVTTGRNLHLATGSDDFISAIRALDEAGYGARARTDLTRLASTYPDQPWTAVLARVDAEVFQKAEEPATA